MKEDPVCSQEAIVAGRDGASQQESNKRPAEKVGRGHRLVASWEMAGTLAFILSEREVPGGGEVPSAPAELGGSVRNLGKGRWDLNQSDVCSGGRRPWPICCEVQWSSWGKVYNM